MKKLSWYAKENGLTYRTAYNHFKKGLIEGAYQLPTGTVVIPDENFNKGEELKDLLANLLNEIKELKRCLEEHK